MAKDMAALERAFPQFQGSESSAEKIKKILDWAYQLQEWMRYTMKNLGTENLNDAELAALNATLRSEDTGLELNLDNGFSFHRITPTGSMEIARIWQDKSEEGFRLGSEGSLALEFRNSAANTEWFSLTVGERLRIWADYGIAQIALSNGSRELTIGIDEAEGFLLDGKRVTWSASDELGGDVLVAKGG